MNPKNIFTTMKKTYMTPAMEVVKCKASDIICTSATAFWGEGTTDQMNSAQRTNPIWD